MKRLISITLVVILFLHCNIVAFAEPLFDVSAKSAVVICADTLEVVYSKNMNEQLPMASTTKIMTAIIALEYGVDDSLRAINEDMISVEGSSIGLVDGDYISLKTLVKGMLLESGNDAANATAHIISGDVPNFVDLMNKKAQEIGMYATSFETPSGLDGEKHYSTAYDMAVLGAYAIKNPEFRSICEDENDVVFYGNPTYRRVFTNHNKLLTMYDGAFGIKTGFTKKSGRCLVSAVEKNGKTLVAVTLSAADDWNDHIKMYDYAFEYVNSIALDKDLSDIKVAVVGGKKEYVDIELSKTINYTTVNENLKVYDEIFLEQFVYAPVNKGDVVGTVKFSDDTNIICEIPICALENVNIKD